MSASDLPSYEGELDALHRAHEPELREILTELHIESGQRVLDLGCGDGSFALWLAERVGPEGEVVGLDISRPYLERAAELTRDAPAPVRLIEADFEADFEPPEGFDHVFCAFSLYSLPDPRRVIERMTELTRTGGSIAVLENDHLHHVLLPWPADLELAVQRAELDAFEGLEADMKARYFAARRLGELFGSAGLVDVEVSSHTVSRHVPLDPADARYLRAWASDVRGRAEPRLDEARRAELEAWLDPESPQGVFRRRGGQVSFIHQLALGRKPHVRLHSSRGPLARRSISSLAG